MKVCFICPQAWPYLQADSKATGGAERQIVLLTEELSKAHKVHLVVGDYDQTIDPNEYRFHIHKSYAPGSDSIINKLWHLRETIEKIDPDICVVRGNPSLAAATSTLCILNSTKFIYNIANDYDIPELPDLSNVKYSIPRLIPLFLSSKVIVQSKSQFDMAKKYHNSIDLVPNGYPKSETRHASKSSHILWVGRLDFKQKQPDIFVDIAEELPKEEFIMIGPGNGVGREKKMLERVDSIENIEYLGEVPPDQVFPYYESAKMLVNTSAYEGFPNTFLEAWRVGKPVIGYQVDPNRFLDSNWECFANGEFNRLISLIDKYASNKDSRREFGLECLENFNQKYTIEAVASEYIDALQ